jgi:DNA-directed RNA polymerase subunit M/transcription elongation factor TFIIS
MKSIDPSQEWQRFKETYSLMSEDELQAVADEAFDLTDIAKQVLQSEIFGRGLSIQLKDRRSAPRSTVRRRETDAPEMTAIRRAWDLSEAREVQGVQQVDGIPSYLGPDPSEQWRRFKETYSRMSEDELQVVANDAYDLIEIAREALRDEISGRGLNIRLKNTPSPQRSRAPATTTGLDSADSVVVFVRRVSGLPEARRVQSILEASNIPSCLGPDNLENADAFEPGFEGEVDVKVCDIDLRRAKKVLDRYLPPERESDEPEEQESADWVAKCPKCHSTEIFLQGTDEESANDADSIPKSGWSCDTCGHQWNDDDIEVES